MIFLLGRSLDQEKRYLRSYSPGDSTTFIPGKDQVILDIESDTVLE